MTKKEILKNKGGNKLKGSLEILTATIIWGYGYIVIRNSLDHISLYNLMTWRYLIAAVLLAVVFRKRLYGMNTCLLLKGAGLGGILYVSQFFQTIALRYSDTTAGRVAFITALYVVLVPFARWGILRKKLSKQCILAAFLAVPGLLLLTGAEGNGFGVGDFFALIGSVGFTFQILLIDRFTSDEEPITLTILQFAFAAVMAGVIQIMMRDPLATDIWNTEVLWTLIYLGVFSTMMGFLMQLLGQRELQPEISAVLLATESVFGMMFSVILTDERLTLSGIAGCMLMLTAVLLAEQNK